MSAAKLKAMRSPKKELGDRVWKGHSIENGVKSDFEVRLRLLPKQYGSANSNFETYTGADEHGTFTMTGSWSCPEEYYREAEKPNTSCWTGFKNSCSCAGLKRCMSCKCEGGCCDMAKCKAKCGSCCSPAKCKDLCSCKPCGGCKGCMTCQCCKKPKQEDEPVGPWVQFFIMYDTNTEYNNLYNGNLHKCMEGDVYMTGKWEFRHGSRNGTFEIKPETSLFS